MQTHGGYEFHYTDPQDPYFSWHLTREVAPLPSWTPEEWFQRAESHTKQQTRAMKKAQDMFWKACGG